MRYLVALLLLLSTAVPVFAGPLNPLPEPETLALLAIGVTAMLVGRRKQR